MSDNIADVRAGFSGFVTGLNSASVDARFAIIVFGGPTELVLDFTSDATATQTAFNKVAIGAVGGFQNNHNLNPEAGLEALRIALGAPGLQRNNVGGAGGLSFRSDARINLILATDEDSDRPENAANRLPGQSGNEPPNAIAGTDWQKEVDNTAAAIIAKQAFVNLLVNVADQPVARQYGNPASSVSDADFLKYDPAATLLNLQATGFGNSLEAQVIASKLVARAFDIESVDDSDFVNNFFAAKVEETVRNPVPTVPEPSTVTLAGIAGLAFAYRVLRARKA
jgi:hypothetical protein